MARHRCTNRAYLLRVWTSEEGGEVRASIRDVRSGETHVFSNLDRLAAFLSRETR